MPGSFALPNPNSPNTSDALTSAPIRQNFQAIQTQLNNLDGAAVNSKSLVEASVADAINPRLRDTEAALNYVSTGFAASVPGSGLTITVPSGVAYVNGYRVVSAGLIITVGASQDTYVDMDANGTFYYTGANSVANNAAGPVLAAGRIRLMLIVSNATAIVQVLYTGVGIPPTTPNTSYFTGFDTSGNRIYNTNANSKQIGFWAGVYGDTLQQSGTVVQANSFASGWKIILPPYSRARLDLYIANCYVSNANGVGTEWNFYIQDGSVGGATLLRANSSNPTTTGSSTGRSINGRGHVENNTGSTVTKTLYFTFNNSSASIIGVIGNTSLGFLGNYATAELI